MIDEVSPKTHTWEGAWWKALVRPSVKTFEELSNDPTASCSKACKWIFMGTLISPLFACLLDSFSAYGSSLIFAPVIGFFTIVLTLIDVFMINLLARYLRGTGTYKQLIFAVAAFIAPLTMISEYIDLSDSTSPLLGYVSLLLGLYGLALSVIAVKAVHQFSWLKALVANFLLPVMFIGAVGLLLFVSGYAPVTVGKDFMNALKSRNDAQAYNLCTADLQAELGSPQNVKVILYEGGGQVTDWGWWVSSEVVGWARARLSGSATFVTGETDTLDLYLIYTDGVWRIDRYSWQGDEESPRTQEQPTTRDKNLPIIKVDELIASFKEIDDSVIFEKRESSVQTEDEEYDTIVHNYREDFGEVNFWIGVGNRSGEDQFEQCEISIEFPKGKFKEHEKQIKFLAEKYISGLVTRLVNKPKKAKRILFNKYVPIDFFTSVQNRVSLDHSIFFENYAYSAYQEVTTSPDTEHVFLLIRRLDDDDTGKE